VHCQEVRVAIAPLLRGFQAEFDSAAKRTKAADSAFLAVYKKLVHMPGQWLLSTKNIGSVGVCLDIDRCHVNIRYIHLLYRVND